jgi:hypothetical protein
MRHACWCRALDTYSKHARHVRQTNPRVLYMSRCLPCRCCTYPLFEMTFFLISFVVCFSVGLLLSTVLIYRDVKPHKPNGMNESLGYPYFWERVLAALFGAFQAGLWVVGITAIVFTLRSRGGMYWVDLAVRCNLHFLTGTNVRKSNYILFAC